MKKLVVLCLGLMLLINLQAQDSTSTKKTKKDWSRVSLANRPKDHFLIQLGHNGWTGMPDTINTKGIPRSFNMYFMFDFPFKTDPRISIGIGAGIGSDNMYFDKTYIDITGQTKDELTFQDRSDTTHFKKYKLNTAYLEAPLELRFTADPVNPNKSFKAALGVKVGTLLSAKTKGKTWVNAAGNTLNAYTMKERAKRYFNGTRLSATARVGYGVFSLYASYQINAFIKEGFGPDIRPLQIGLTISGL
jgi:hypothetical protein